MARSGEELSGADAQVLVVSLNENEGLGEEAILEPNELMQPIHHRMMAILPAEAGGCWSARNVALSEDLEAVVAERLGGDVGVFHVEGERAFALGPFDEAVDVVDVDLGFEERGQHVFELRFTVDLDGKDFAFGVRIVVVDEKLPSFVWIVDDQADDRAVGGVENRTRHDVGVVVL